MTEQSSSGADNASPWSSDVPIPAAPVEFSWTKAGESDAATEGTASAAPNGGMLDGPTTPGDVRVVVGDADRRRRQRAGAGIGVVMLLAVTWLAFGRGDGSSNLGATADSSPAETDSGDSLPTVDDPVVTGPESTVTGTAGENGGGSSATDEPVWRQEVIELPQELRESSESFEIVATTSNGTYIEVEVPTGRMDVIDIGNRYRNGGRVIAAETVTLLANYDSSQKASLIRVGEPIVSVDLQGNIDVSQFGAVGNEFRGLAYGNVGEPNLITVSADGSIVTTSTDDAESNYWQRSYTLGGSAVVSEAGGVYVEQAGGAFQRVSSGQMIVASPHHVLVRECDDTMTCGYATIELATGERADAVFGDAALRTFGSFDYNSAKLSPDGHWLRFISYGADAGRESLVDMRTGTETDLGTGNFNVGNEANVWSPDSSGFFRNSVEAGFGFFDVATGENIAFGASLGNIQSFDIRSGAGLVVPTTEATTTTGVSLIALTATGDIAQIDVDSAAVVTIDGPELDSSAQVVIVPDAAGAMFVSSENVPLIRYRADGNEVLVMETMSPGGPLWPGPLESSLWSVDERGGGVQLQLVDAFGGDLDGTISLDSGLNSIIGSDGRGGILVEPDLGGIFAVAAGGAAERITNGELLAINSTVAYVRECDDALQCGVFMVDRVSGERSIVNHARFAVARVITVSAVPPGQSVSPDGAVVFVRDLNDSKRCLMIDSAGDGDLWAGVPCAASSPIIWTPDSSAAVWLNEGQVTVFDRASRSVRRINTVGLMAIAAVSTSVAPVTGVVVPVDVVAPDAAATTVPTE